MSDGIFSHLEYCFVQNEINAKGEVETAAFKCFEENDEITSVSVNGKGKYNKFCYDLIFLVVFTLEISFIEKKKTSFYISRRSDVIIYFFFRDAHFVAVSADYIHSSCVYS